MGKPDTRRLDREIQQTERKLKAVREREMWPLDGRERRAIVRAVAGGAYSLHRGNGTARADQRMDTAWESAEARLNAEIEALKRQRQRIVNEAAAEKAVKKSTGWW